MSRGSNRRSLRLFLVPVGIALWMGAVSGLVQVVVEQTAWHFTGEIQSLGPHMIWMVPMGVMLACLVPGLGLGTIAFVRGRSLPAGMVYGPVLFLAGLNLILFIPGTFIVSDYLIAAGLTVVILRVHRRYRFLDWLVRRTALPVLVLLAGLTVLAFAGESLRERAALASLPPAPTGKSVLLLVLDTVRGMDTGLDGYDRPTTPQLRRWAARGVTFTHAIAPSSWTLPSHSTMFTGHWPEELGVDWKIPLGEDAYTLAEYFDSLGYATAGFAANPSYGSRYYGLAQGFQHYEDFPLSFEEIITSAKLPRDFLNNPLVRRVWGYQDYLGRKRAPDITRSFLRWLPHRNGRPFFAFLNLFDAHEPYLPPPEYDRLFASNVPRRNNLLEHFLHQAERREKAKMTPAERARERDAYDADIRYMDTWIGWMLDSLDRQHLLDSTIVIITSDHGEQFGEHGKFVHGTSLYRQVLEVPMLILAPGEGGRGSRVGRVVSLRDLPATILDLLGHSTRAFPGTSLVSCWRGPGCGGSPALSELRLADGDWGVSLFTDSTQAIVWHKDIHFYAWRNDPQELEDLAKARGPQNVVASIRLAQRSTDSDVNR